MTDAIGRNINSRPDLTKGRSLLINGYSASVFEKSVGREQASYASSYDYNIWLRHFSLSESERLAILAFKYSTK